ncbi:MAG: hypothetical protein E7478_02920 [Ruminococcaceae bacterium]|nr:hypothetical protein [Oscillospiraceae bacterium]
MINVSAEQMERVSTLLRDLPGNKTKAALANAANRAMTTARSEIWKAVHEQYTVKRTAFYRDTKIKVHRANASALGAALEFRGNVIPLIDFNVSGYRSHERRSVRLVKAAVYQGASETLKHAYIANLGTYGEAVFERLSPKRNSSSQLYGPSAAHMAANADVTDKVSKAVQETFDKRLEHEIDRIIRGYGV